jgi:acetyl esterase/lipase
VKRTRLVREIAVGAEAAVVCVEYDGSPEARYPTAIEQAYAATRYVVDNGAGLLVDPLRLAVAGDSVGGNMAAAVTLMAKAPRPEDRTPTSSIRLRTRASTPPPTRGSRLGRGYPGIRFWLRGI